MLNPFSLVLGALSLFTPNYSSRCSSFTLPRSSSSSRGAEVLRRTYVAPGNASVVATIGTGVAGVIESGYCTLDLAVPTTSTSTTNVSLTFPDKWNRALLGTSSLVPSPLPFATYHLAPPSSPSTLHEVTALAKALTKGFYKRWRNPRTYWASEGAWGGRSVLEVVQAWPGDFAGVAVGGPALSSWDKIRARRHWLGKLAMDGGLEDKAWKLVKAEVQKQCEVIDGIVQDPRSCHFIPETLTCRQGRTKGCLTTPQLAALRKMYTHKYTPDGEVLYHRIEPGSEDEFMFGDRGPIDGDKWWSNTIDHQKQAVFAVPETGIPDVAVGEDITEDWREAEESSAVPEPEPEPVPSQINEDLSPDLTAFAKKGGKLLHFFGLADPVLAPQDALAYHSRVLEHSKRTGGKDVDEFYSLFPVPGLGSLADNTTASPLLLTLLDILVPWVEKPSRKTIPNAIVVVERRVAVSKGWFGRASRSVKEVRRTLQRLPRKVRA
ncbi:hypothetical protein RQP46_009440 [Phenoliferia psychrophenolica]